jgi:hypothetical protein
VVRIVVKALVMASVMGFKAGFEWKKVDETSR